MDIPGSEVAGSPVRGHRLPVKRPEARQLRMALATRRRARHQTAKLEMVHAFVELPDSLKNEDSQVAATWKKTLKPGESVKLHLVMVHAWNAGKFPSPELVEKALDSAKQFTQIWDGVKSSWEHRWKQMFTPGNDHFSGHLPILNTSNEKLSDIYYRSISNAPGIAPNEHE